MNEQNVVKALILDNQKGVIWGCEGKQDVLCLQVTKLKPTINIYIVILLRKKRLLVENTRVSWESEHSLNSECMGNAKQCIGTRSDSSLEPGRKDSFKEDFPSTWWSSNDSCLFLLITRLIFGLQMLRNSWKGSWIKDFYAMYPRSIRKRIVSFSTSIPPRLFYYATKCNVTVEMTMWLDRQFVLLRHHIISITKLMEI